MKLHYWPQHKYLRLLILVNLYFNSCVTFFLRWAVSHFFQSFFPASLGQSVSLGSKLQWKMPGVISLQPDSFVQASFNCFGRKCTLIFSCSYSIIFFATTCRVFLIQVIQLNNWCIFEFIWNLFYFYHICNSKKCVLMLIWFFYLKGWLGSGICGRPWPWNANDWIVRIRNSPLKRFARHSAVVRPIVFSPVFRYPNTKFYFRLEKNNHKITQVMKGTVELSILLTLITLINPITLIPPVTL